MTAAPPEPARGDGAMARLAALLCLLPAALLAWPGPGAPLANDLVPELTGAGLAALAALPAAALALLRARAVSGPALAWAGFALACVASWVLGPGTDTLERDRAFLELARGAALLACGALASPGVLARGAVALSLAFVGVALVQEHGLLVGTLGNTGALSEAALPGALAGAVLAVAGRWPWRWIGGAAALAWGSFAGLAPVWAGALAALTALAAWVARAPGDLRPRRAVALGVLLLAVAAGRGLALAAPAPGSAPTSSGPPARTEGSSLGGFEVRARIWSRLPALFAERPLLGTGPGQLAAVFPPHRDPVEIELSTLGRAGENEREVEHAHSDLLQGLVEAGLPGAPFWIAFVLLSAGAAWRGLGSATAARAALAAGALGALANAALRAPLLANPAASTLALALVGALAARGDGAPRRPIAARALALVALAALLGLAPRAAAMVRHGTALAALFDPELPDRRGLDRALEAAPDSVLARTLSARRYELVPGHDRERALAGWRAVLELRPHRFEALVQLGARLAEAGRLDEAREAFEHAERLDPGHPRLARNLARLAILSERDDEALRRGGALLERDGGLEPGRAAAWAVDALRRDQDELARALLARAGLVDAGDDPLGPERSWALADDVEATNAALARALRGRAHLGWARQQAAAGDGPTAVRSYRQALAQLAWDGASGEPAHARRPALELAAALALSGRPEEAREALARAGGPSARTDDLPAWARAALGGLPETGPPAGNERSPGG